MEIICAWCKKDMGKNHRLRIQELHMVCVISALSYFVNHFLHKTQTLAHGIMTQ